MIPCKTLNTNVLNTPNQTKQGKKKNVKQQDLHSHLHNYSSELIKL